MRKIVRVLLFTLSLVLGISFLSILVASVGIFFNASSPKEYSDYQFYSYNERTSETGIGMVTIPQKLDTENFISYRNSDQYYLISKFGTEGYRCTGTCSCEEIDDERRNVRQSTNIIHRGLTILVGATTSMLAYSVARDRFHEECHNHISDECTTPGTEIFSEVEECYTLLEDFNTWKRRKNIVDVKEELELVPSDENASVRFSKMERWGGKYRGLTYSCRGTCKDSDYRPPQFPIPYEAVSKIFCSIIYLEAEVKFIHDGKQSLPWLAKKNFAKYHLRHVCETPKTAYEYEVEPNPWDPPNMEKRKEKVYLCEAKVEENHSIRCTKTDEMKLDKAEVLRLRDLPKFDHLFDYVHTV